ncbi:hypothetical protein [Streptomonospora wellingtoniae]|uniref:Uncharacterized protein n=1 Tax=Streptomonospora wellingtoniae TaxID=3075544 RepID=A0ABU2KTG7_9ACTN|nr:hypothetical protein [Streptomonospora sp. DSM 45055]MDT0302482.1 hypothetical protein [Streptomonospora sp. DSM 45055]
MSKLPMDKSTGFIPEDELVQLAEPPEDFAGGDVQTQSFTTAVCAGVSAIVSAASTISIAAGGGCPTTACTTQC